MDEMAVVDAHRGEVAIRELGRSDRAAVGFVFRHLGAESRYQRFLTPKRELSERELERLIDVDHWHHEALIAWSSIPRAPIGIARYVRGNEFDLAELAVAVADGWQRIGVGGELMRVLAEHACRAGIRRFTATALASNRGAIAVARRLDGSLAVARHGHVVELSGSLAATTAQRSDQGVPPRVATISSSARCSSSLIAFPPTPRKPPSL
jgi:RimJ/RimL family protein N-acetyltransferase